MRGRQRTQPLPATEQPPSEWTSVHPEGTQPLPATSSRRQVALVLGFVVSCYVAWWRVFFETWRFPAQNIITNCSQCEVPRRTAAGMEPVQKDHATVNFPGCKALPTEAPIA